MPTVRKTGNFLSSRGFTLMELMIAALVLALVLVGLLASYISCMQLTELMRNTSVAMNAIQAKAEEIKGHTYANIKAEYDRVSFTPSGLNGIGVSYVDDTNPELIKITVSLSWRQSRGLIIGEDRNLNGQWDTGEDTLIVNNILDSPAAIVTYIAEK